MRFSAMTLPRDPSHPRRQRNADQLHHHLIIPAPTATPTEPPALAGNPVAPLACDPGVRHPLRQRRAHPVPLTLPPPSPSPPLLSPTAGNARTQHRHRGPSGSFRASFSEDADTDVGGEGGTDDEFEDADGRPAFVSGPRYPYPRSSAREVAPRFSHPHNLPGVNTTRIAAQPVCLSPLLRSPSAHLRLSSPPILFYYQRKYNEPTRALSLFELIHASDLPRQLRPRWHSYQHHDYPYGSSTRTV